MSKYHSKKVIIDGIKFDSKKEGKRYEELKILEKSGLIKDIELQPKFLLIDTIRYNGKTYPKTYYIADFRYYDNHLNKYIVEDVKSEITAKDKTYRLKIKMLLSKYPDINFVEIMK